MPKKPISRAIIIDVLQETFNERAPFNSLLGIQVHEQAEGPACIKIDMKPELIGNFVTGVLHGGVITSLLDVIGGWIAIEGVLKQLRMTTREEVFYHLSKLGTIDLRVDFLRPGKGKSFAATGTVLRTGKRVAVTRTEFRNEENLLIAVGTGTYIIG